MKRKRQRKGVFGAPVEKAERGRKKKRGRIINYEYDLDAISHLWGGFTPFAPKDCPSQRCVISMEDNIKWVDNTLCLRYCPDEEFRCESHKMYREHLHEMREYLEEEIPIEEIPMKQERTMIKSRGRVRQEAPMNRTRSRRRIKS